MTDTTKQDYSGITSGLDMAKVPLYGQEDQRMQDLLKGQEDILNSLQKRYDQPNWWKVAAGFAKPQLGGFLASAGSAAEAMGENVENQRAQQLPIATAKLGLLQNKMILKGDKDVTDQVKRWRDSHPGETPSAQQVGEWEAMAPNSKTVASLKNELKFNQEQQGVNVQAATAANAADVNDIARAKARQAADLPLSEYDKAILYKQATRIPAKSTEPTVNAQGAPAAPAAPAAPKAEPSAAQVAPAEAEKPKEAAKPQEAVKPKNIYITPEGARVSEDLYKDFYKNGKPSIPIISNIRTQEEQDALKDHQDDNGKWFTKQDRPVSENSKHLTGDAIDLDPSKKLTKEQVDMLKSKGWSQPDVSHDPNHWERTPAQAAAPAEAPAAKPAQAAAPEEKYPPSLQKPDFSTMGDTTREIQRKAYQDSAAALEAPNVKMIQDYQPVVTGTAYTTIKSNYDSAIDMIQKNPALAQQVFALMRKEGFEAALNAGIGFHAGSLTANVSLPIEAFKDANRPEAVKAFADSLFAKLGVLAMANVKAAGGGLSQTPQQEYMNALHQFANSNMTSFAAKHLLNTSRAEFAHKKETYDQVIKELGSKVDMDKTSTPYTDIIKNSSELAKIHAKHAAIQKKYNDDYNERISKATRSQGNTP